MSSIELRGLEVSQGFWDAMCSLNLIYVKVKAIVLTKERNTINMQSAVAGNTAVADAGSERDVGWGSIEMQPWKTQPGGRCMGFIYYLYFFSLSPFKTEKSWSSGACRNHLRWHQRWVSLLIVGSPLSPALVFGSPLRPITSWQVRLQKPLFGPEHNLNSSCSVRHKNPADFSQSLLWVWVYLS